MDLMAISIGRKSVVGPDLLQRLMHSAYEGT